MIRDLLIERKVTLESCKGDLLDKLVDDAKKEKFLSDDYIVIFVFGILLASFETISTATTLALKFLTEHPLAMQELIVSDNYLTTLKSDLVSIIFYYHFSYITLLDSKPYLIMLQEEHEAILKNKENPNSGISWKEYKSMTFTHQVGCYFKYTCIYICRHKLICANYLTK